MCYRSSYINYSDSTPSIFAMLTFGLSDGSFLAGRSVPGGFADEYREDDDFLPKGAANEMVEQRLDSTIFRLAHFAGLIC